MSDLLAKKKNEKKCFSIEFLVKIEWDPPVGPLVTNVLIFQCAIFVVD